MNWFERLRDRHIFRTAFIYLGGAWASMEAIGFFVDNYGWSRTVLDVAVLLIVLGFPAALIIAWYHGESGKQQVQRTEASLLLTLAVLAAIGTFRLSTAAENPAESDRLGIGCDPGGDDRPGRTIGGGAAVREQHRRGQSRLARARHVGHAHHEPGADGRPASRESAAPVRVAPAGGARGDGRDPAGTSHGHRGPIRGPDHGARVHSRYGRRHGAGRSAHRPE